MTKHWRLMTRLTISVALAVSAKWSLAQPQPGSVLWSYDVPGQVTGCPTLAKDGTIYLACSSGITAITNAGSNKWSFTASPGVFLYTGSGQ
jgi:outer membrane protein assembly factor BamB